MSLLTVTKKLGKAHATKKESEKSLEDLRLKFFDELTKDLRKGTLAQKTVPSPEVGDIFEWVKVYHPGWVLIEENKEEGTVLLEEDPTLIKHSYINHKDGQVYQRNVIQGTHSVDDESLAEDHPDVWRRISYPIEPEWISVFQEFKDELESRPNPNIEAIRSIDSFIEQKTFQFPRELFPLEELDGEDLQILAEYMVPGPLSLRLESPRKAKQEELDQDRVE